ncbi:MAG TPA: tRNA epoxyqueuosine(34) reductase QueG [Terriglobia bacterium]|nr:tRNA epoxyqueuosine(34) reductase QueG [Terriglobia bacterium]
MALSLLVKQKAFDVGFDLAGIAPVGIWKDLDFARKWVEQGYGGEMHYLQNPKRHDPRQILPSAQSVVCVGLIYNAPFPYSTEVSNQSVSASTHPRRQKPPESEQGSQEAPARGWISRYAWGQDYHEVLRTKLEELRKAIEAISQQVETRVYVDTGPVVERAFARYSGIGWMGKNTCLINQNKGSWFFLGVLLTNLPLDPGLPAPDRCGSCTKCLEACPTGALVKPYVMDASRCIAYFNIELKGSIPEQYRPAIGANIFGCDICQDVCPWNRSQMSEAESRSSLASRLRSATNPQPAEKGLGRAGAATTTLPEFQPIEISHQATRANAAISGSAAGISEGSKEGQAQSPEHRFSLFNPPIDALAQLSEEGFRRAFARSPIKRPKYRGWLRNLSVVMGNSGDRRFIPKLEELSRHRDPVVREHAQWALERLAQTCAGANTSS